jgi:hypothetical protein
MDSGDRTAGPPAHRLLAIALSAIVASAACGKSGPPLPPLRLVPAAVSDVVARRVDNEVRFTFVLPKGNANGPGPVDLDRIEVYAGTVAPGAVEPGSRDLFVPRNLVGRIAVKPPARDEAATPAQAPDPRPSPGEMATFVEVLTAATMTPVFTTMPPAAVPSPSAAPEAPALAPVAPLPLPPIATRVYAIRGVSRGGRSGPPAARVTIPLVEPPPPPSALSAGATEAGIVLTWTPPAAADAAATPLQFNVYRPDGNAPVNTAPLAVPTFDRSGVEFGKEECFVVRSVVSIRGTTIESAASERACTTPSDTFPPLAPKGLQAIAATGAISLIWDANTEADLAGYIVLRGEAPGDTLQALTPAAIPVTTFVDTTVKPGVRYVYAIIAVDRANPPNVSAQSNRVEETAR